MFRTVLLTAIFGSVGWLKNIWGPALAALVGVSLLCSCAAPGRAPDSDVSSSATSASKPASSTSSAAVPQRASKLQLSSAEYSRAFRGPSSIYTDCLTTPNSGSTHGKVFDPATGQLYTIPTPSPPPGGEIIDWGCTAATTPDNRLTIIYVVTAKIKSEGLNPESEQTNLVSVDATNGNEVLRKPIALPEISGHYDLRPTVGGFFLVSRYMSDSITAIRPFDAATLEPTAPEARPNDGDLYVNFDSWVSNVNGDAHVYSVKDGKEQAVFPSNDAIVPVDHGFIFQRSPKSTEPQGVFYFNTETGTLTGPIAPPGMDEASGRLIADTASYEDKSYGSTVVLTKHGTDGYLIVYDGKADKELLRVTGEQLAGLNIDDVQVGGDYLYLSNKSDNPVIDLRSGKKVSTGWEVRAVAPFPNGWVLIRPGGPGAQDNSDPYLATGAAGPYSGPWY